MASGEGMLTAIRFDDPDLWALLEELRGDPVRYDALDFGLVAMDLAGRVLAYNATEAAIAGCEPGRQLGRTFFTDVAPCTNTYLVSGRFEAAAELDETIDYVFTIRLHPLRVRLRLLKRAAAGRQYLAVAR